MKYLPFYRHVSGYLPHKKRLLSDSVKPAYRISYECSKWVVPDMELTLMERSIINGCRSIITRSCDHLTNLYDCLQDLNDTVEQDAKPLQLTHILAINRDNQLERILHRYQEEIHSIHRRIPSSFIANIGIQLPDQVFDDPNSLIETVESIKEKCQSQLQDANHVKFGLAFDAEQLTTKSIGKDPNTISLIPLPLQSVAKLYSALPLELCVLPTNLHTLHNAIDMQNTIKASSKRSLTTIATEILRIYSHKPGYIAADYDGYRTRHSVDKSSHSIWKLYDQLLDNQNDNSPSKNKLSLTEDVVGVNREQLAAIVREKELDEHVKEAAVDVHLATDRCYQLERAFLAKFSKDLQLHIPNLHYICLAHCILSSQDQFFSLEAFDIILHSQILPLYEQLRGKLYEHSRDTRDWVLLYKPMAQYLINAYKHLLQVEAENKSKRIISKAQPFLQGSVNQQKLLPYLFAHYATEVLGADQVGLTLTKIDPYREKEVLELASSNEGKIDYKKDLDSLHQEIVNQFVVE